MPRNRRDAAAAGTPRNAIIAPRNRWDWAQPWYFQRHGVDTLVAAAASFSAVTCRRRQFLRRRRSPLAIRHHNPAPTPPPPERTGARTRACVRTTAARGWIVTEGRYPFITRRW